MHTLILGHPSVLNIISVHMCAVRDPVCVHYVQFEIPV
jgi:hypothetical protein